MEFAVCPLKRKLVIISWFIFLLVIEGSIDHTRLISKIKSIGIKNCHLVLALLSGLTFTSAVYLVVKSCTSVTSEDDSHTLLNSDYALSCHMQAAEVSAALNPVLIQGTVVLSLFHIFFSTVPPPQPIQCTKFSDYNSSSKLS